MLLLMCYHTHGQLTQDHRYEIALGYNEKRPEVVSLNKDGFLLLRQHERPGKNTLWEFNRMDTSFNNLWHQTFRVERKYILRATDTLGGYGFFFLNDYSDMRNALIIRLNSHSGEALAYKFRNLVPMSINEFKVVDGGRKLLVGGYFNYRPVVVLYDLLTNRPNILPGLINHPGIIIQLEKNDEFGTINLLVRNFDRRSPGTWLKTYSYQGQLLKNLKLESPPNQSLIHAHSFQVDSLLHISAGVFGKTGSDFSYGVFVNTSGPERQSNSKIYFGDLDNFFSFLKPGGQERKRRRVEKKKAKNKEKKFYYRMKVLQVEKVQEQYVLLAEAYYMKYNNSSYAYFEGFKYTHATVVGFDETGKVLWDNSIKIEDVKTLMLDQVVFSQNGENSTLLLYQNKNKIHYSIFFPRTGHTIRGETAIQLKHPSDQENSYNNNSLGMKKWFPNTWLCYGIQQVRNFNDTGIPFSRKVFFINKLQYSEPDSAN